MKISAAIGSGHSSLPLISACKISTPSAQDAVDLARLGSQTFRETYAPDNDPRDIAVYLERHFHEVKTLKELSLLNCRFLIAKAEGTTIGYAKLRRSRTPVCVSGDAAVELQRLYVRRSHQGHGIGTELLLAAFDSARGSDWKHETLWLCVDRLNPRAISFYERNGFAIVGEKPFPLGRSCQLDLVMERPIERNEAR